MPRHNIKVYIKKLRHFTLFLVYSMQGFELLEELIKYNRNHITEVKFN